MLVRSLPAAAAAALFILSHQAAVAQPAPAAPAAPAAISPAQAAAQSAFERLDEAERKAIQNDLIWSGDFNGVAGGEFGRRTFDAIRAFERRVQVAEDGILSPPERARLKQAADQARAGLRFATVTDQATGIAIGMPQSILTQRVVVDGGVVYRRQDGQVSLLLQRLPPQPIAELFERLRQDGPNRKVTYRLQRPDWFVLSGDEGARKFYTRVAQGADGLRIYTFRYPAAESREMDRLMIAIANTFDPFPGSAVANAPPRPPQQPGAAPQTPPPLVRSAEARHAVSGVVVAPGKVLTSAAALKSCGEPSIGGQAVAAGAGQGELTILSVATGQQPALALAAGPVSGPVYALSFEEAAQRSTVLAPARMEEGAPMRLNAALQIAPGGAPAVDARGALVALVKESPRPVRMVAGVMPAASYPVIDGKAIAEALQAAGITPAPQSRGLAGAAASLVEIRCARRL